MLMAGHPLLIVRLARHGGHHVPAFDPFADRHGKIFRDLEGYRLVLPNAAWPA